jgi:hypothetical protein
MPEIRRGRLNKSPASESGAKFGITSVINWACLTRDRGHGGKPPTQRQAAELVAQRRGITATVTQPAL